MHTPPSIFLAERPEPLSPLFNICAVYTLTMAYQESQVRLPLLELLETEKQITWFGIEAPLFMGCPDWHHNWLWGLKPNLIPCSITPFPGHTYLATFIFPTCFQMLIHSWVGVCCYMYWHVCTDCWLIFSLNCLGPDELVHQAGIC